MVLVIKNMYTLWLECEFSFHHEMLLKQENILKDQRKKSWSLLIKPVEFFISSEANNTRILYRTVTKK